MSKRDYYDVLGITRSANDTEIKKAYRSLASKLHPDKGGSTEKFQELQEAYDNLSDPQKREAFNRYGHNAPQQQAASHQQHGGMSPDQFSEIFGGMFNHGHFGDIFGRAQQQVQQVSHLIYLQALGTARDSMPINLYTKYTFSHTPSSNVLMMIY